MQTFVLDHRGSSLLVSLFPDVMITEVGQTPTGLVLTAFVPVPSGICKHCATTSTRVHSYYTRQPRDLPVSGQSVRLVLHLRRFRCPTAMCLEVAFAKRIPALLAPAAQRTVRLNAALADLAPAFSGEDGARQSACGAMPASPDTLLRRAHRAALPGRPTPRVLGIDDFAFRKGQVYVTTLTDGETHTVVDVLGDRSAETTATWLQEYPEIEIVTRDRASDYARDVRAGAPNAVQVADRFHLVKNAGEVIERVVQPHHQGLRRAARTMDQKQPSLAFPIAVE